MNKSKYSASLHSGVSSSETLYFNKRGRLAWILPLPCSGSRPRNSLSFMPEIWSSS